MTQCYWQHLCNCPHHMAALLQLSSYIHDVHGSNMQVHSSIHHLHHLLYPWPALQGGLDPQHLGAHLHVHVQTAAT